MDGEKTAAAYIRVSTGEQSELSPDSQLAEIRRYAAANGYRVPDEYVFRDIGISGRTAAKRPAFNTMISAARARPPPFSAVLLWKFSRFARNQEESLVYKNLLRKDGIDVFSVTEPVSEGPFGALIESIIAWMDEYYSIRLSGEVQRSMRLNAEKGKWQSTAPFGYRVQAGKLIKDEAEAPLVVEIFQRFVSGEGKITIARSLAERGVVNRRGRRADRRTIDYVLSNPAYIGKIRYTPRDADAPIISDGKHEPLIPIELWEAARKRDAEIKQQHPKCGKPSAVMRDWLSGLVTCAYCGKRLVKNKSFFQCHEYARGLCHVSQRVTVKALHEAFLRQLRQDMSGGSFSYSLQEKRDTRQIQRLKSQLESLDRRLKRHKEAYASGVDTLDEYKANKASVEEERRVIREKIEEAEAAEDPEAVRATIESKIQSLLDGLNGVEEDLTQEDIQARNEAIRALCGKIIWDKPRKSLSIIYRV